MAERKFKFLDFLDELIDDEKIRKEIKERMAKDPENPFTEVEVTISSPSMDASLAAEQKIKRALGLSFGRFLISMFEK